MSAAVLAGFREGKNGGGDFLGTQRVHFWLFPACERNPHMLRPLLSTNATTVLLLKRLTE